MKKKREKTRNTKKRVTENNNLQEDISKINQKEKQKKFFKKINKFLKIKGLILPRSFFIIHFLSWDVFWHCTLKDIPTKKVDDRKAFQKKY